MNGVGVILAAGEGTRMKSSLPKVLHEAAGRPLIGWVEDAMRRAGLTQIIAVVGNGADQIEKTFGNSMEYAVQTERLGSGHAAMTAAEKLRRGPGYAFIAAGDMPLLTAETIREMMEQAEEQSLDCVLLSAIVRNPAGYGRIVRSEDGQVVSIVEHKDADDRQREIREINASCYCVRIDLLLDVLPLLDNGNAQGEYYLTDIVRHIRALGGTVAAFTASEEECLGVNDRVQLWEASRLLFLRTAEKHMREGVTMLDASTVYIDPETEIGPDTIVYPGVILESRCRIGKNVTLYQGSRLSASTVGDGATVQNSVLIQAEVGPDSTVGPYAYLRPGTVVGSGCRVGDFVELKNCNIGNQTKVPHLTYVGDADLGSGINMGCGCAVANYDGKKKYRLRIEDGAFVGCNTSLVSPVSVGKGAYIGAGSVITEDVPPESLALARSREVIKKNWKDRRR